VTLQTNLKVGEGQIVHRNQNTQMSRQKFGISPAPSPVLKLKAAQMQDRRNSLNQSQDNTQISYPTGKLPRQGVSRTDLMDSRNENKMCKKQQDPQNSSPQFISDRDGGTEQCAMRWCGCL
jgi:hypothetical protein